MGTRADFYIKDAFKMYWLGSIGWDGYPEGIDKDLLTATGLNGFKARVSNFLEREDATLNQEGWPWPWIDSNTTDYAYVFDVQKKQVFMAAFGGAIHTWKDDRKFDAAMKRWQKKYNEDPDNAPDEPDFDTFLNKIGRTERFNFPNMKDVQNVKLDGVASGIIVIRRTVK